MSLSAFSALSASDVIHEWAAASFVPNTPELLQSFVKMLINNNRYVVAEQDEFTILDSICVLVDEQEIDSLFELMNLIDTGDGCFVERDMFMLGHKVMFIIHNNPYAYAIENNYRLIKFSENGIYDYTQLLNATCPHRESLAMELFHPRRIAKWLEAGNEVDQYMA